MKEITVWLAEGQSNLTFFRKQTPNLSYNHSMEPEAPPNNLRYGEPNSKIGLGYLGYGKVAPNIACVNFG